MSSFYYLVLFFCVCPILIQNSSSGFAVVSAEDEVVDPEDVLVDADDDGVMTSDDDQESSKDSPSPDADDEEDDDGIPKPSPNADTTILFTTPTVDNMQNVELPAGKLINFVIGITNKGARNFLLESSETTLRYPQDMNYVIQNYSAVPCELTVAPQQQASVQYSFMIAEALSSRSFRLMATLRYKDSTGRLFSSAVFNQTVQVVEVDDGLDGETFFLYLTLALLLLLALFAIYQLLFSSHLLGKRRRGAAAVFSDRSAARNGAVERGTGSGQQPDYDWLPESTIKSANSPKSSPRQSPRQRKVRSRD